MKICRKYKYIETKLVGIQIYLESFKFTNSYAFSSQMKVDVGMWFRS